MEIKEARENWEREARRTNVHFHSRISELCVCDCVTACLFEMW